MKHSENKKERIKAVIKTISDDTVSCKHFTSGYDIKAYINKGMQLEVGQVVILEYKVNNGGGGYIIADTLMEEVDAKVLEAQHIIDGGTMHTSVILENLVTHQRMHSMISATNKLFSSTNILITGDKVKMRINNGQLFSIKIDN